MGVEGSSDVYGAAFTEFPSMRKSFRHLRRRRRRRRARGSIFPSKMSEELETLKKADAQSLVVVRTGGGGAKQELSGNIW